MLLLITGVDRRHKYLAELDSLISSAFLKACEQSDKSATDKSSKSVADQIVEALKAAKIVRRTKLEIEPGDTPTKPTELEPAGGDTSGPKGGAPNDQSEPAKGAQEEAKKKLVEEDKRKLTEDAKKKLIEEMTTKGTKFKIDPAAPQPPSPAPAPSSSPSTSPAPGKTVTPPGTGAQKKPGGSGESEP